MVAVSSTATMSTRGGEDLLHLHVAELNGGADQLALVLVQAALILGLVHHGDELLLGDALVLLLVEDEGEQLLPLVKRKFRGRSTVRKNFSRGAANMAKASGDSLARLLGGDLAKNQMTTVSTTVDTVGP